MKDKTIGIIGAMNEEVELFLRNIPDAEIKVKAGIRFHRGTWNGKQVVVCKCGVGKVNAAICTQILIDTFAAEAILFTGVAGAVHPELNIGDIVISTDCMQHDMDVRALGFDRGVIPFSEESIFVADPALREKALAAGEELFPGTVRCGRILSGDQFVASREKVAELYQELEGACVEMEGAAVAQTANLNGVPFIVLRSMSDKADGSAHVNFPEFVKMASERSAAIVERTLRLI